MTDNDTVGIGVPDIVVAKKSDKTKNIVLENGRYTGKRKYGTYKAGEEIKFTITVSNSGTASARNITIKEEPSKELKKYVQILQPPLKMLYLLKVLSTMWRPQNNDWFNSNDLNNKNHGKFFSSFSFSFLSLFTITRFRRKILTIES